MPKKPKEVSKSDWAQFVEKDKYFTYDSAEVFKYKDSSWISTGKQYFKYTNAHLLQEEYVMDKEGDSFVPNTKQINTFDSLTHKLVEKEFYKFDRVGSNTNTYNYKYGYKYNKEGNLILETKTVYLNYRGLDPFSWVNMSGDSEIYTYNVHGVPVEKKIYEGIRNEVWTLKVRLLVDSFSFDGQPVVIHASGFFKNGKEINFKRFSDIKWYKTLKDIDDAQLFASKAVIGVPRSGTWMDSVIEYTYHDAAGNIDSVVDYPAIGNSPPPLSKQVFGYGPHNCRDTMNYAYTSSGQWRLTSGRKEVASYDADKLTFIVTVTELDPNNTLATKKETWMVTGKKVYH